METAEEIKIPGFGELNFIGFYTALQQDDPSIIGVDKDVFDELSLRYKEEKKIKLQPVEMSAQPVRMDMLIIRSCLIILAGDPNNDDIFEVIESFKISTDQPREDIMDDLTKKLSGLHEKLKLILDRAPTMPENNDNAYDVLARLASGLEYGLNFKEVTVAEYISLDKVVQDKQANLKKR